MTKEQIQSYTLRVSQASKTEMIIILYDLVLDNIKTAKENLAAGEKEAYHKDLKETGKFLSELMKILDFSVPLSYNLMSLYMYSQRLLVRADVGEAPDKLADIEMVINKLKAGFEGIKDRDESGPMMTNVQQVYAGLTYGKGHLNEAYINASDYNRGFNA
ncbi:MAG: flagellar protein FliS [Lachnospiraceae bacterium]|nr:flagellar protein FliS [Lachnospiraceae bacterium]